MPTAVRLRMLSLLALFGLVTAACAPGEPVADPEDPDAEPDDVQVVDDAEAPADATPLTLQHMEVPPERVDAFQRAIERFNDAWMRTQAEMFDGAVTLTDGYRTWWSYVPHFVATPGYVYAYAYGNLLSLALYRRYEEEGAAFVPRYLELLAAGGSASPEALLARVGVDLTDPAFWDAGLDVLADEVAQAEKLAGEIA